ncbi:LPD29 domain-containing protein [Paenarthrobacter sp. YIM B13468]|uniref:LPD29 domain-containing protein n=1 Tax=Paenarthrobacter sp. YIM B13468 TaxID=3366295 RepID=UPI003671E281
MTETTQQYSQAETNRLIRAELKATYPGTAFTVRASNGAGITQTVIGWEISYRPTTTEFDGYYSPVTCELTAGPSEAEIDALAARYSSWEWAGDDGVRDHAPERLVATEAGRLPQPVRYGAGNVTAYPRYRNVDL